MKWPSFSPCRWSKPLAVVASAALAILCGCVGPERVIYKEATKYQLVDELKRRSRILPGYRADNVLYKVKDKDKKYSADGWLGFVLPLKLRVFVESFGYEFLLISDGQKVFIVTPDREGDAGGLVHWGPVNGKYVFRPEDIISALGIIRVDPKDDVRIEKYPTEYVLVFLGPRAEEGGIRKRVIIERQYLRISRVQTFARDGTLFMDAQLSDYRPLKLAGGREPLEVQLARKVFVRWPTEGVSLRMRLKDLDPKVDPAMFHFPARYNPENGYKWIEINPD